MKIKSKNPFLRFNIEGSDYLERPINQYEMIELRKRALIFILDYSLLFAFIYLTIHFVKIFTPEIPDSIIYITIAFYSIVFISIEYYFDGTIFKVLFNIRSMNTRCEKLGIHIFIIKFLLRPIAFVFALIYLKFCFAILLWLFGIYKPLFKFLNGKMDSIWYDDFIKQIVTKIPNPNG
ncbi:hypothetical protein [uncultured Dokdonia sp.]|uniref:hypothetical protein n=1 Tax=uncultured Dokdonia sp. TaxID=575653 RepID=UPI002639E6B9|nr:hypothetical protein [uncultured Dokdonia sp.]